MAFTEDKVPACRCTAHPAGEDLRRWMFVAEETREFVVWCCQRCSEIARTPVIQVRTFDWLRQRARHERRNLDRSKQAIVAQLRAMQARRRVAITYKEADQ